MSLNRINNGFDNVKQLYIQAYATWQRTLNPNVVLAENIEDDLIESKPNQEELVTMMSIIGVHMNRLFAHEALIASGRSGKYIFDSLIKWICGRLPELRPIGVRGDNFAMRVRRASANDTISLAANNFQ